MHDRLRDFFEEHTTAALFTRHVIPQWSVSNTRGARPRGPISTRPRRGSTRPCTLSVVVLSRAFDLLVLSHGSWDGGLRGHALMMERHLML